jgi:hypothetical protein
MVLHVVKLAARSSMKILKMNIYTFCRSRPPPKQHMRLPTVEEPEMWERRSLSEVLPVPTGKEDDGSTLGPVRTLSGNCLGLVALSREHQEQLRSNHCENHATGKEGEANHRHHKHNLRKKRNGGMPLGYLGLTVLLRE